MAGVWPWCWAAARRRRGPLRGKAHTVGGLKGCIAATQGQPGLGGWFCLLPNLDSSRISVGNPLLSELPTLPVLQSISSSRYYRSSAYSRSMAGPQWSAPNQGVLGRFNSGCDTHQQGHPIPTAAACLAGGLPFQATLPAIRQPSRAVTQGPADMSLAA